MTAASGTVDRRLTPARPDLAAAHLRDRVKADRYVEGVLREVVAPIADLKSAPAPDAPLDTQALFGERVTVYEDDEGFAWAQLHTDGYVGYLPAAALGAPGPAPTHRVAVARTFLYPGPNMKLPAAAALPFGARVASTRTVGDFAIVAGGAIFAAHLQPIESREADFVAVAERFEGAPYLWGGRTPDGFDCSGFIQAALAATGRDCPRDTDMQAAALGVPIDPDGPLQRGDVVFWKGHVGVMRDALTLLHASGRHMLVTSEPFAQARERIAAVAFGAVTGVRRLAATG